MDHIEVCFGTHKMDKDSIIAAIKAGYKYLDTATGYRNALTIKEAVNGCEISIITKFNPFDFTEEFDIIADNYINELGQIPKVVLLHTPFKSDPEQDNYDSDNKNLLAMNILRKKFPLSQLGVSNFSIKQVEYLLDNNCPVDCIQVEFSPYYQPVKLLSFCSEKNIKIYSYRLTSKASVFNDPTLKLLANKYSIPIIDLLINWCAYHKIYPVISSKNPKNIKKNISIKRIRLSDEDLIIMRGLDKGKIGSTCMLLYTHHDC